MQLQSNRAWCHLQFGMADPNGRRTSAVFPDLGMAGTEVLSWAAVLLQKIVPPPKHIRKTDQPIVKGANDQRLTTVDVVTLAGVFEMIANSRLSNPHNCGRLGCRLSSG